MMGNAVEMPPMLDPTDSAAVAGWLDAQRLHIAGELFAHIRAVAKDARNHQGLPTDTGQALDEIIRSADIWARGTSDEDEDVSEWLADFPP